MGPSSTDVILLSDCDEIWRADKVAKYANTTGWSRCCASMAGFCYYMNCCTDKGWKHPRWVKGDDLDRWPIRQGFVNAEFDNAGWHFSYLGDIKEKLGAFAHDEYDKPPYNTPEHIAKSIANRESIYNSDHKFRIIDDLSFMPRYVLENFDKFKKYIYIKDGWQGA